MSPDDTLEAISKIVIMWIDLSIQVRAGSITAEEAVKKMDSYMVPLAKIVKIGIQSGVIRV
jgi:hypothetical protein